MNIAQMSNPELVGALVGFFLTLMIFSYILGDNPLFRIAVHIFIGVAAGYAAVMVAYNVIWPQLILPLFVGTQDQRVLLIVPLLLSSLLLMKASPKLTRWGSPAVAFIVGVGAAAIIGGSVLGTLFPQALATMNLFDGTETAATGNRIVALAEGAIVLIGTLATLIYFQFEARPQPDGTARRSPLIEGVAVLGSIFIAVALGAAFAGVYAAALTALVERVQFIVALFGPMIFP